MQIEYLKTSSIKPYEKNAKKHDKKQVENVAESIKQFGFVQPVVVDKNNNIIIGHCRLEAAKKLHFDEVPCVMVDDLTDVQVKKLRLLDNKLNESEWDIDLIAEEIIDLDFDDFDVDFGVDTEYKDEDYSDEFSLKDGDREPIQNMTFTFSDDEAEIIKEAISQMKKTDKFKDYDNPLNQNRNGKR